MSDQVGYVAITNPNWINNLANAGEKTVNYWIRKNSFKVVPRGSIIFILEKGRRDVRGYGYFDDFKYLNIPDCWNEFKTGNGSAEYDLFLEMLSIDPQRAPQTMIGCVKLIGCHWVPVGLKLEECGVKFPKSIVSGKRVIENEINKILSMIEKHDE